MYISISAVKEEKSHEFESEKRAVQGKVSEEENEKGNYVII